MSGNERQHPQIDVLSLQMSRVFKDTACRGFRLAAVLVFLVLLTMGSVANVAHSEVQNPLVPIRLGSSHSKDSKMDVATRIAEFTEDDDIVCLQFSPDNRQLATSTGSTLHVRLWAWQGKAHVERTLMKPPGTADVGFSSEGLRYSPDGKLLAVTHSVASRENGASVVDVFDPSTGADVHGIAEIPLGGSYSRIEFTPDGKFLVRTFDSDDRSKTGQFLVHRSDTLDVIWTLNTLPLNVQTLALTRDGKLAAVSGETAGRGVPSRAQILIVDLEQRKVIRTLDHIFPPNVGVEIVAWHPDGIHLAAGADGTGRGGIISGEAVYPPEPVKIFDASTGETVGVEAAEPTTITGLRYTSDGKYLVESGYPTGPRETNGLARIWDGQHQRLLQEIPVKKSYAMTISRDDRYLAIGDERHVSIWTLK